MRDEPHLVNEETFKALIWTLCGLSSAFLASRLLIRLSRKESLKRSDSPLLLALPSLFAGSALLSSTLDVLYDHGDAETTGDRSYVRQHASAASRLTAAVELLWITIYCVKGSFLLQFKFHKPPYSLVSANLSRHYWVTISVCTAACLCTLAVPPTLCPSSQCRYFHEISTNTRVWEVVLTTIDIVTDLGVISIPVLLIRMANFTLSCAILNTAFKCLSVLTIAIAATRLAFLCKARSQSSQYTEVAFWLIVEASVALAAAAISSYRVVLFDLLCRHQAQRERPRSKGWVGAIETVGALKPRARGEDYDPSSATGLTSVSRRPIA